MSAERLGYGTVDPDYGMRLATTPRSEDGPIWMVNLMAYRKVADYGVGNASGIDPENGGTVSGREADDRYAPLDVLADIGADVVFIGDVEDQLLGDVPRWDRVGVVRYQPGGRSSRCSNGRTSRKSTSTRKPEWPRQSWPGASH